MQTVRTVSERLKALSAGAWWSFPYGDLCCQYIAETLATGWGYGAEGSMEKGGKWCEKAERRLGDYVTNVGTIVGTF